MNGSLRGDAGHNSLGVREDLESVGARDGGERDRDSVIPGWSTGPDLRCAIARRGISRFRVRCFASPRNDGICSIPNMTSKSKHDFAPSRRNAPEALPEFSAQGGRGERRVPAAPAVSCALGSSRTHTSNNEYTGIARRSRTQWFYDLFRALPGDRAFLPPSLAD
jgi:hypothetical protein